MGLRASAPPARLPAVSARATVRDCCAQLLGAGAMAKVVGINDDAAMNKQIFAIMVYMMASYFGGTIADDEAAKAAAAAKEKVK